MMTAAVVSAANPCTGWSFTILCPKVRIILQPPAAVPAAIVAAQSTTTQELTLNSGVCRKSRSGGPSVESERDDAHCLLGIVRPVAVGHPGRADELQLAKDRMNEVRRERTQENQQKEHEQPTGEKTDDG